MGKKVDTYGHTILGLELIKLLLKMLDFLEILYKS
jgi:hypothetical protein